jgi:hypothetical protein
MALKERCAYSVLGVVFGAFIGLACWWLYGLGNSLNYNGPGMDPILRHWLTYSCGSFAAVGFLFRERVGDAIGDTINAIFHFESNHPPGEGERILVGVVFTAIIIAAIWYTTP